jgi:hypothetical protein
MQRMQVSLPPAATALIVALRRPLNRGSHIDLQ